MVRYVADDGRVLKVLPARQARKKRIAVLVMVLSIGVTAILLNIFFPESVAYLLSLAKTLVKAIWNMFRDMAAACGEFIDFVFSQRS